MTITMQDVTEMLTQVNHVLEVNNKTFRLAVSRRYDYTAVDMVPADHPNRVIRGPLVTGTKQEVYNFLAAFNMGLTSMVQS
jgi:hypothetical protein